jgi:hypothetical protein
MDEIQQMTASLKELAKAKGSKVDKDVIDKKIKALDQFHWQLELRRRRLEKNRKEYAVQGVLLPEADYGDGPVEGVYQDETLGRIGRIN